MNPHHARSFRALHEGAQPLCLANAWDALSARLVQESGGSAVATSSAALAWSLGYADGERLPRERLLTATRDLLRVLSVPLSVDLERGYSERPHEVAELVLELAELGVAGVNLEDGNAPAELLARKLEASRGALARHGHTLFLNARSDSHMHGSVEGAEAQAVERGLLYARAGADGFFVPGLFELAQIGRIAHAVALPLNVWWRPEVHPLRELAERGVRRVSVGPRVTMAALRAQQTELTTLLGTAPVPLDFARLNAWFATST